MQNSPKAELSMESIAQIANYEGNDSLLLIQRLSHPTIRRQVIELLSEDEKLHAAAGHRVPLKDEAGKLLKNEKGEVQFEHVAYTAKSAEELESAFDKRLQEVAESTPISHSESEPVLGSREVLPIAWKNRGEVPSIKYMSAVEAHEKGHYVRHFVSNFFGDYFAPGFDPDQMSWSEEELARQQEFHPELEYGEIRDMLTSYMSRGMEIAERMSQLKNYFGMTGNEQFTASHLAYAREHYVSDTGIDNGMTQFFQAITPATQKDFLRLINHSGI